MSILVETPFLTARATGERKRILDPLGVGAVGANIVRRHLLPGITGSLRHVRYFGLMTWVVGSYEVSRTRLGWANYRRRIEHGLRLAIKHADPHVTGLIGTNATQTTAGLSAGARIPLAQGTRIQSAFEAQNYGASFGGIGLAIRPPSRAPELTGLGHALFDAIEQELECESAQVRAAAERLRMAPEDLRVSDVDSLSQFFALRPVEPDEPEWEPLLLAVGGMGAPASGTARTRSRTLALILAVLEQRGATVENAQQLLDHLSGPNRSNAIVERYGEEMEAWRCFGERQAQRVALSALWGVVHRWVAAEASFGLAVDTILSRACALLPTTRRRHSGADIPIQGAAWQDLVTDVDRVAGASRAGRFERRVELMRHLRQGEQETAPLEEWLVAALRLLALCDATWQEEERSASEFAYHLHGYGGESRLPMSWLADELRARERSTVADVLRWLLERCVLEQLQRVGFAKGPGSSKVLFLREEGAVVLARDDAQFTFVEQDANRLGAALEMLTGLSLVEWNDGRARPTFEGVAFRARVESTQG